MKSECGKQSMSYSYSANATPAGAADKSLLFGLQVKNKHNVSSCVHHRLLIEDVQVGSLRAVVTERALQRQHVFREARLRRDERPRGKLLVLVVEVIGNLGLFLFFFLFLSLLIL